MRNFIKQILDIPLIILAPLTVILFTPVGYILGNLSNKNVVDNILGGLFSTAIALAVGIPTGQYIDRKILEHKRKGEVSEMRKNEREVLLQILEELEFNLNGIFKSLLENQIEMQTAQFLKTDSWDVFVSSNKLNVIESYVLLNRIASAYYVIKNVRDLQFHAYLKFRTSFDMVVFNDQKVSVGRLILNDIRYLDPLFNENVSGAITEIKLRIKRLLENE